jgi:sugar/nucleoside kinase (ribokinase family)
MRGNGPGAGGVICVLGDALLDVVVRPAGPIAAETDTAAVTVVGAGGQAANVAAWITALGGQARLIAARAGDRPGQLVAGELASRGVTVTGPLVAGRTGVVVSLSDGGRSRSMLTDPGVGPLLMASALEDRWFAGCGWLHLPAYSLVREPIREAALAAADRVRSLSVDLSSTAAIRSYGVSALRALLMDLAPRVVFGTEAEVALTGELPGCELVIKLGPRGIRAGGVLHPAHPAEPVDSTGAGDAFAAGYLVGGISAGLAAAARAVSRMGAMP